MYIGLPAETPTWVIGLSVLGSVLIASVYGLARLARTVLPTTSAERLAWWKVFWQYRRDFRRDRWAQRENRWARRHGSPQLHGSSGQGIEHVGHPPTNGLHEATLDRTLGISADEAQS